MVYEPDIDPGGYWAWFDAHTEQGALNQAAELWKVPIDTLAVYEVEDVTHGS